MDAIANWWSHLEWINQWFYVAAAFFSVFFLWQLISALIGLGGDHGGLDHDVTTQVDTMGDHGAGDATAAHDAAATVDIFRLLSFRSVLAFFTMFTWAGALYLNNKTGVSLAFLYSTLWGVVAMVVVGYLMNLIRKLTETGNISLAASVGAAGTVYVNIPSGGLGEVRVPVSGVVRTVRARVTGDRELKAGSAVRVNRVLGPNLVEVEPA
jgi:hypothetical protein